LPQAPESQVIDRTIPKAVEVGTCALVICMKFNASITSWYRTSAHNAVVGGDRRSQHLTGEAIDLEYDEEPPPFRDVQKVADRYGCHVVREFGANPHDHIQARQVRHG
jgi:hypothetical protein